MRIQKQDTITRRVVEILLKNLEKLTFNILDSDLKEKNQIQIVQESIVNGWKNFYELKKENMKKANTNSFLEIARKEGMV